MRDASEVGKAIVDAYVEIGATWCHAKGPVSGLAHELQKIVYG